jgi:preprotein translocase subunit SecE
VIQYSLMTKPLKYLQEVNQELKKVTWPSRQKTFNMTLLVVAVSLFIAMYIAGADFIFTKLLAELI